MIVLVGSNAHSLQVCDVFSISFNGDPIGERGSEFRKGLFVKDPVADIEHVAELYLFSSSGFSECGTEEAKERVSGRDVVTQYVVGISDVDVTDVW